MKDVKMIPQRDGYGLGLLELCKDRQDVMVLDADVAASTRTNWVRDQYPDHFMNRCSSPAGPLTRCAPPCATTT